MADTSTADGHDPKDSQATTPGDEPMAAGDGHDETAAEIVVDELTSLQQEVHQLRDRLARARADYDNLQKRQQRDAALERDRVKARVLEDFLQVYEYGKMAEFEADRNPGPLAQGVKMVVREFDRMLETNGVQPVGKVGEPFNMADHEAFETVAVDGVAPGHISKVIQLGYRLGERLLRPAKVAVAPDDGEADDSAAGSD